jgi:hypothetical protein
MRTQVVIIESPGGSLQVKRSTGHETKDGDHVEYSYHFHPNFDLLHLKNGAQLEVLVQHVKDTPEKDSAGRTVCIVDIQLPCSSHPD